MNNTVYDQRLLLFWSNFNTGVILLGFLTAIWYEHLIVYSIMAGISITYLILLFYSELKKLTPTLGAANWVSIIRFVAVGSIFIFHQSMTNWAMALSLTVFVLADLLDGYFARKLNQESNLGMQLDMEVDAFFVLGMCLYFYLFRSVEAWILIPGLLRYVYKCYTIMSPRENFVEQKQKYASLVAGVFFAVLLIAIVVNDDWIPFVLLPGAIAILGSFGISFRQFYLWKEA